MKSSGGFGVISLAGYTLVPSELILALSYLIFLFLRFFRQGRVRSLRLWTGNGSLIINVIVALIVFSCIQGLLNGNDQFLSEFRVSIFSMGLFLLFLNLPLSLQSVRRIVRWWSVLGAFVAGWYILLFFAPNIKMILSANSVSIGTGLPLTMVLFSISTSMAMFLFGVHTRLNLMVFLIGVASVAIRIGSKDIVLAMIGVWISVVAACFFRYGVRPGRYLALIGVLMLTIVGGFGALSSNLKAELLDTFSRRILKLTGVNTSNVLTLEMFLAAGSEKEGLDSGRFEIWRFYLGEAVRGYGLSRKGLGYDPVFRLSESDTISKGKHNIVVYFFYEFGVLAGFLLVLIVARGLFLYFCIPPPSGRTQQLYSYYAIEVGLFGFAFGMLLNSMVGLRVFLPTVAWFCWFSVVVVLRFREMLNDKLET
ncbi:hypothetical protein N8609_02420 [Verrucomicrobia bacterium]|nr:hypothetical protein [Verrucomicrobiota bacterium]